MNRGELEGRFDPFYYIPLFKNLQDKLLNKPHKRLREIAYFSDETWDQISIFEIQFPYIEISEIDTTTGELLNISPVSKSEAPSRAKMIVRQNDIIVSTTRPGRGAISFLNSLPDEIAIASTGFAVIRKLKNRWSKEFLLAMLRSEVCLRQMEQRSTGGNYPAINQEALGGILLPNLPDENQELIANRYIHAITQKSQQESQAQDLLDSIDGYLLSELDVTLPPEPDNTIENRMFKTAWRQVSGGRFDPTFQKVVVEFNSSIYPSRLLRDVVLINPNTKFKGLRETDEVTFVPMENVSEDGGIDTSLNRIIADYKGYTAFSENDLLIAKITPCMENGKTGVARNLTNNYGFGSTEFHVFRPKSDELNIDFLHAFFHADFFRQNAKLTFGGSAGHQRVPPDFFKQIRLPIPPLAVQKTIVEEITSRQQQAQTLRQQAQRDFTAAKQEIEKLILG